MDAAQQLRLKVSGAGHNIELTVDESETIGGIKAAVLGATGLHPSYQRLLVRGKAFDDDSVSLSAAGIGDRTKLMLLIRVGEIICEFFFVFLSNFKN